MSVVLPPIGFWSYSRDDDRRARGRLSQLRALLSEELESRFGRRAGVRLFQDVSAIEYGDLWEQKITEALDQCSFMIPILTPDFLQSEWCCKEVIHFQQREATLGRTGLIFPIRWIDTARINPADQDQVHDRRVWDRMQATQRVELHHLRLHEPEKSLEVQRVLHALADRIEAALRGAAASVADEARLSGAATDAPSIPPPSQPSPPPTPPVAAPAIIRTPQPGDTDQEGPDFPKMILIPAGSYQRGVPEAESKREGTMDDDARPIRTVTIPRPFWLGVTPVTRGQFAAFVNATGYDTGNKAWTYEPDPKGEWGYALRDGRNWRNPGFKQDDSHPVVCINHADAMAYVDWLNTQTKGCYRLPSEAEWEYAARANSKTARYWGETMDQAHLYANTADQSLKRHLGKAGSSRPFTNGDDGHPFTSPVAHFRPNDFGLHDMLGNVWEWCADRWHDSYNGAPDDGSAWTTPESEVRRVLRGGSWYAYPGDVRAGVRYDDVNRDSGIGCRLARTFLTS